MKSRKILLSIMVLIIIIIGIFYYLNVDKNNFSKIESEMVQKAKEFVLTNNMKVDNQEYIFLDELNVDNAELCIKSSGVIVTKVDNDLKYTPYLKCKNYESQIIENDETYIKLIGNTVDIIPVGSLYLDDGYNKLQNVEVTIVGDVIDKVGAYTLNYVIKNISEAKIVKRIVIVSDRDNKLIETKDLENPTITLNGERDIVLALNETFVEPGFISSDSIDGNLTDKIKIDGMVNTSEIGDYKINYSVKNSHGRTTTVTRNIKVVSQKSNFEILSNIKSVNDETVIELQVLGAGLKKIILPDGKESLANTNNYKISQNGSYVFKIIDNYDNEIIKTIVINSIDTLGPTGKCVASKKETEYVINVNATDDNGIKGIIYIINGNESGLFNSYQYRTSEIIENLEVIIVDLASNKTRITCKIND